MGNVKSKNIKKCVSLLREFIDGSQEKDNKKGVALLALGHLQKIMAGEISGGPQCNGHPRADIVIMG